VEKGEKNLDLGQKLSAYLTAIVSKISTHPAWLLAKGGITSSDLATQALGIRRAIVKGQILPGVPVWAPDPNSRFPYLSYIIFPGNVGDDQALYHAWHKLNEPPKES
ncbi:MAG: nucleotide-binding domain containing protein, partial [Bacteroidota bacterium]